MAEKNDAKGKPREGAPKAHDASAPKAPQGDKGAGAPKPKGGDPRKKDMSQQVILGKNGKEIRGIVRMTGKDIKGQWTVKRSITSIKGIGVNLGSVISGVALKQIGADEDTMIGEITEEQMRKLETVLSHPEQFGVPGWMLNRQRDVVTGETKHLIGTDLQFSVKQDIEHEKDIYTWRGYRHAYGQKVRGQHTRSTGRTGMTVGVLRKAVLAKAGAAAAQATGAAAQAAGAVAPAKPGEKKEAAPKAAAAPAPAAAKPAAAPKGGEKK